MSFHTSYLLHSYPYRDTSAMVKLFTEQQGLITAIARGVKKQGAAWRGLLQPFVLLNIHVTGKGEVKTVIGLETKSQRLILIDKCLISGLYLNEILINILAPYQPYPEIFHIYETAITGLSTQTNPEPILRNFELDLLEILGYLPNFLIDEDGNAVLAENYYLVMPEHMPKMVVATMAGASRVFQGNELMLLVKREWSDLQALKSAKRLLRDWIQYYCKGRPLKSRELLMIK